MLPSIFGENLLDDLWNTNFDRDWFNADRELYGKHAKNLMKTDVREAENGYEMAIELPGFQKEDIKVDLKDGYVAVKGWTEQSTLDAVTFCRQMQDIGVKTLIVTDISKDGAMQGTNHQLYRDLQAAFPTLQIVASGGVSSMEDVRRLAATGLYGAIIGKAYYVGAIDLKQACEVAQ